MGYWPAHPATCPECGGNGQSCELTIWSALALSGPIHPSRLRCDLCHGLGKIEQHEADAWARSQAPDPADAEADDEHNAYHQGYK